MGIGSAGLVVELKRPTGEYLATRRVTAAGGETEVRKMMPVELDDAMAHRRPLTHHSLPLAAPSPRCAR